MAHGTLIIPINELVVESTYGQPCGCCQWMGVDPDLVDGVCSLCGRSEEQIVADHGELYVNENDKRLRKDAAISHMMGIPVIFVGKNI